MSQPDYHPFTLPVYQAGEETLSVRDLLFSFLDPDHMNDGISRISDLHFKVGEPVNYRYDGHLEQIPEGTVLTEDSIKQLIFPLLADEQVALLEGDKPADLDAGFYWREHKKSFRLNVFHDSDGLACAVRMLPNTIPPVERLGFHDESVWHEIANLHQGFVLVTGITGSGKSTTIASLLTKINATRPVRIITLEDPIEYFMESDVALISQRQVGKHVSSFQEGLRSALREDPDIIYVGEIRDRETASLAVSAAETGHLVLTTLHTKSAIGAMSRLVDMFPSERSKEVATQLSFVLSHVIGQKLVARADHNGRTAAIEVLKNVHSVSHLIRSMRWHQIYSVMETQSREGMITLEKRLLEMVANGTITEDEAYLHANNPSILGSKQG